MALPNRAAAFRAACRHFVAQYLLANRYLLDLSDLNEIRLEIWRHCPELETDLRTEAFKKYFDEALQHLMPRLAHLRPPPVVAGKAWSENEVRAALKLRADLGKTGLQSLQSLQAPNQIAALICLRDKLDVILAERFFYSDHLSSFNEFDRAAQVYRTDDPILQDIDRTVVAAQWQSLIDDLATEARQ